MKRGAIGIKTGRKLYPFGLIVLVLAMFMMVGCATFTQNKAILGVGDWWVADNDRLKTQLSDAIANGDMEYHNFLMENVAPYMDLAKYGIIGWNGIKEKNDVQISHAVKGLLRHGARFDYDPAKLVAAIKAEDYDTVRKELLRLKNLIVTKWLLPEE